MINEKIKQAISILNEKDIDMWLTFVRETASNPDPMLDLILGTQCVWPSAFIITARGKAIAIVGSLDAQNIRDHADYKVIGYVDSIKDELLKVINEINPERIAINFSQNDVMADGLTHGMHLVLSDYLRSTPFSDILESSEQVVAALRGRKSQTEIERIQSAIDKTLQIFDEVSQFVKIGMTEENVASFIRQKMKEYCVEPGWDPEQCPAVFTGPESAGAHASPTDREIEPGHIMNIDFGVRKDDYVSDLQRTWYFLQSDEQYVPDEVRYGFDTIRDAIKESVLALKPGIEGWRVDAVARNYILEAGYGEYHHALGHQIGRKAHDGSALLCPKWDRYKNLPYSIIEENQVFTLEPRLSVAGHGVVTIEEIVVVTKKGCRFLSKPQEELIVIK
jgi:Xaa-Pro aminopeptidase